jgi:glycine/D-amino acid oxidase-like deaminating enzyme
LWWAQLDPAERRLRRAPLAGDTQADVAIVGAGYTGLWTALSLLRADPAIRVVVLEASVAGAGASSRNGGWCSALLPLPWDDVARRFGAAAADAWEQAIRNAVPDIEQTLRSEGIDCGFARDGVLQTASDPAQLARLRGEVAAARARGQGPEHLALLSADGARALVGSPHALGGTFSPHCAAVQPALLVRGLAHAVERRGGVVAEATRAWALEPGRVRTDRGDVRARYVVRATEGYTAGLPGARRDLLPMVSSMIATEPLPATTWERLGWARRVTFFDGRRHLFYAQRTADGRIAFGGRGAPYRWGSRIEDPVRRLDHWAAGLRRLLVEQFPVLAGVRITHRWGGVLGVPRGWLPAVRLDPGTGLATAGGYSGDGVALAHLAGRTLADLLLGRRSPLVQLPMVGVPLRRWEPEPARWAGARTVAALAVSADRAEARGALRPLRARVVDRFA